MIRQSVVMTGLNLLSLPQRWGTALIDVFGVACVVALLVTGSDDSVLMVVKNGAEAENDSSIARDVSDTIVTAARAADPALIGSPESSRLLSVKRPLNHDFVTIALRGVGPNAVALRDGMRLTSGRMFQSGRYELIVGRASQQQFAGLQLGSTLRLKPTSDTAAANIRERLQADPNLGIGVQRERDYFQGSINGLFRTMRFFAHPVLLVMAIGAVFAGLNTMYGAVAARTREIGVARSIGFGATPVAMGVLVESVLLSLLGGMVGVVIIRLALNGMQTNTNFLGDTQFAFNLVVPGALMPQGVLWAGVIGLLGGLLPAVRAGRLPIVEALRDT
jgi:putative ABC transport system permease protein